MISDLVDKFSQNNKQEAVEMSHHLDRMQKVIDGKWLRKEKYQDVEADMRARDRKDNIYVQY